MNLDRAATIHLKRDNPFGSSDGAFPVPPAREPAGELGITEWDPPCEPDISSPIGGYRIKDRRSTYIPPEPVDVIEADPSMRKRIIMVLASVALLAIGLVGLYFLIIRALS